MRLVGPYVSRGRVAALGLILCNAGCFDWDARAPAGVDSCAQHEGAIICDDFSSMNQQWDESVAVQIEEAPITGSPALHASSSEASKSSSVRYVFSPRASGTLYVRARILIPDSTDVDQINFLALKTERGDGVTVVLRSVNAEAETYLYTVGDLSNVAEGSAPDRFELGRWHCLELALTVDDAPNGLVTLSKNGQVFRSGNIVNGDTLADGGYVSLSLPISYAVQDSPFEIWIDDLVLDDRPVGCD